MAKNICAYVKVIEKHQEFNSGKCIAETRQQVTYINQYNLLPVESLKSNLGDTNQQHLTRHFILEARDRI
jgi:hypothetical protein